MKKNNKILINYESNTKLREEMTAMDNAVNFIQMCDAESVKYALVIGTSFASLLAFASFLKYVS